MFPRMVDVTVLLYTYAVVLTAGYATMQLGIDDRTSLFVIGLVITLFWSGYFRYSIEKRVLEQSTKGSEG